MPAVGQRGTRSSYRHRDVPAEPEYVGELERLAQLREQGILSEEEFEAKKKQLLGI
jgi:Short C-terminal domain